MSAVRIAVLVSGGGTNLQALLDAQARGELANGEIAMVLSNKPGVLALERAARAGVPAYTVERKTYNSPSEFEAKIEGFLRENGVNCIVLAGWLYVFSAEFTKKWENRVLNVHPSLIPSFCGKGMYGLRVHEAAIARGARVTGATVHFVTAGADEGPIILQKAVEIREDDTPETLQRRVMEQAEWQLLPRAVALFCQGRLTVEGRRVHIKEGDHD